MVQIEILAGMKRREWKTATKRSYTRCFVENIFNAMERPHTPSDIIYLDEYSTLKLSKDFCVLCEVYDCYPKEFLEYFMGFISVADADVGFRLKGEQYHNGKKFLISQNQKIPGKVNGESSPDLARHIKNLQITGVLPFTNPAA